jgi:hypothetical protein
LSVSVGTASVAIIPSFAGFQEAMQAGMADSSAAAADAGAESGAKFGEGFADGAKNVGAVVEQGLGSAPAAAADAGAESGAKFTSGFTGEASAFADGLSGILGESTASMGVEGSKSGELWSQGFSTSSVAGIGELSAGLVDSVSDAAGAGDTAGAEFGRGFSSASLAGVADVGAGLDDVAGDAAASGERAGALFGEGFRSISVPMMVSAGAEGAASEDMESEGAAAGEKFGGSFSGSLKGVLEGIGAIAAFEFLKDAIGDGNSMSQSMALLQAHLTSTKDAVGLTADQIENLAAKEGDLAGKNAGVELSGATMLLTFTNIKGAIYEQALPAINNISAAMGVGLPQAAKMVGKALNDPLTGMTALSRAGIQFSATQKELIKNWVDTGHTAEAQQYILDSITVKMGGSAQAAATPIQKLKAAWWDFSETVGTELIPVVDRIIQVFTADVLPVLTELAKLIGNNSGVVLTFVAVIGGILVAMKAWALVNEAWAATMELVDAVTAANPITLLAVAIVALVAIVGLIIVKMGLWHDVVSTFNAVVSTLESTWTTVWSTVKAAFDTFVAAFMAKWNSTWAAVSGAFNTFTGAFKSAFTAVWSWVTTAFNAYVGVYVAIFTGLWSFFTGVFNTFTGAFKAIFTGLWSWVTTSLNAYISVYVALFTGLWNLFTNVFNTFVEVFKSAWNNTWSWATSMLTTAINTFVEVWRAGWTTVESVFDTIITAVKSGIGNAFDWIENAFRTAVAAIGAAWSQVSTLIEAPVKILVNTVYDDGIAKIWNDTAGAVGLPKLPVEHFASGGPVKGGVAGKDSVPAMLMPGEHVLNTKQVSALGGHAGVDSLTGSASKKGEPDSGGVQHFGIGGIVSSIGGAIASAAGAVANTAEGAVTDVTKLGSDVVSALQTMGADAAGAMIRDSYNSIVEPMISTMGGSGGMSQLLEAIPPKFLAGIVSKVEGWVKGHPAASTASANVPGDVSSWISQGMQIAGVQGADWSAGLTTIAMSESGGNQAAVNTTDSNAKAGHPSAGLMQFIESTFNAYAKPGYTDWMNPIDQVVADAWPHGYIDAAYGSIDNVPGVSAVKAGNKYVGYDNGGPLAPGVTMAYNGSGSTEGVLTTPGLEALGELNSGKSGSRGGDRAPIFLSVSIGSTSLNDLVDARIEADNTSTAQMAENGWVSL